MNSFHCSPGNRVRFPRKPMEGRAETQQAEEPNEHQQMQWLLSKMGNDMGLGVWVAKNDRNREFNGQRFTDLPKLRDRLPSHLDEATSRVVEHIDVLWLDGESIVAAFEVEYTSPIYSGLLRMSDLVAMNPNLRNTVVRYRTR